MKGKKEQRNVLNKWLETVETLPSFCLWVGINNYFGPKFLALNIVDLLTNQAYFHSKGQLFRSVKIAAFWQQVLKIENR